MRTPIGVAAEIDDFRIERLDLRELSGEVLLVGGHPESPDDLAAQFGERLAEVLIVPLAVIGGVMDDRKVFVAELGKVAPHWFDSD